LLLASAIATGRGAARAAIGAGSAFLLLLVHGLAELHRGLRERIGLGGNRLGVVALERLFQVGHRVLDRAPLGLADLGAVLGERLLGRMHQRLGVVLGFHLRLALLVLIGVGLGILDHLLDVGLAQAARRLDADLLLLAGALVPGVDVDDAVGVDVEG